MCVKKEKKGQDWSWVGIVPKREGWRAANIRDVVSLPLKIQPLLIFYVFEYFTNFYEEASHNFFKTPFYPLFSWVNFYLLWVSILLFWIRMLLLISSFIYLHQKTSNMSVIFLDLEILVFIFIKLMSITNWLVVGCLVSKSCPTLWPYGLCPTRLLCPWDFWRCCHFLLWGTFIPQASQWSNPNLLHWQGGSLSLS